MEVQSLSPFSFLLSKKCRFIYTPQRILSLIALCYFDTVWMEFRTLRPKNKKIPVPYFCVSTDEYDCVKFGMEVILFL